MICGDSANTVLNLDGVFAVQRVDTLILSVTRTHHGNVITLFYDEANETNLTNDLAHIERWFEKKESTTWNS